MALITPHGGSLTDIWAPKKYEKKLRDKAASMRKVVLSDRLLCDYEMIANGVFSPLKQFMGEKDYKSVLKDMRLANGLLFPVPVTFPTNETFAAGEQVALTDGYGNILAIMTIEEQYSWSKAEYAKALLGSNDKAHPLVQEMKQWGKHNIAGPLVALALPPRRDFAELRLTPHEVRGRASQTGNDRLVAFQTRNPLHRAHEELTKRAASKAKATLLIHPVVGMTKPGDIDYITRVRCYKALIDNHYKDYQTILSLMPLAMRMAGPREALWHAIIRRNYGASHFIVGRDHAGPGKNSKGENFYEPYAAQELVLEHAKELGMDILTFNEMVYIQDTDSFKESHEVTESETPLTISGTQVREDYLAKGKPLPEWFSRPEVSSILIEATIPAHKRGYCFWFTGLSGAGKSTIATELENRLIEQGRVVTMLDGDIVRRHLSKGLGFSREDRDENIKRIGFVAAEVVKHEGIAICAAISPYEETRRTVRSFFEPGKFIEIYVSTPLETCEARDPKGLYAQARRGEIKGFTGIDDTYEVPTHPELTLDTSKLSVDECVQAILDFITK